MESPMSKAEEYERNVNEMRMAFNNKGHQESSLHLTKKSKLTEKESIDYLQHYMFVSVRTIKDTLQFNFRVLLIIGILLVILTIMILVFVILDYKIAKNSLVPLTSTPN